MIGSLAECFAKYYYGLDLYACSNPGHDARVENVENCKVEIKATQGDRVALRSGPDRLLVFRLLKDGTFEEVYNGPGAPVWTLVRGKGKAEQRAISGQPDAVAASHGSRASRVEAAESPRLTRRCSRRRFAARLSAKPLLRHEVAHGSCLPSGKE
jgi:hypothetical protein